VKAWVTGGPYAAVYLYGFRNATRHRKKCYIHRLVATHFVSGRKKNEVVHHKSGPANNTASQLEWTSVEENAKARKFLGPDAKPKKRKVKSNVQRSNAPKLNAPKGKQDQKEDHKVKPLPKEEKFVDKDEYIPGTETLKGKILYLYKNSKEFKYAWLKAMKAQPTLKVGTLAQLHKDATGKGLKLDDKRSPYQWKTKLISALYAIRTRLKT